MFWVLVAPTFLGEAVLWMKIALIAAHIIPLFWLLVNYFLTESTILLGDWWHSFTLVILYLCVNYCFTKSEGVPVYPFMTWEDPLTFFYSIGCWAIGHICTYICSRIQLYIMAQSK